MKARLFVLFVLIVLILIFILQNTALIDLKFLFWVFNISSIVLVLITLLIGIILGLILSRMMNRSGKNLENLPKDENNE